VQPFTEWFQINWQGQVVGWSKFQLEEESKFYRISQEEHFEGRVRGKRMKFVYEHDWYFSKQSPYLLTKGSATLTEPSLSMVTNFENQDELTIEQVRNNNSSTFVEPSIDYRLSDVLSLRKFVEEKPRKGTKTTFKKLDTHSLELSKMDYQVIAEPLGRHQRYLLANLSSDRSDRTGVSFALDGKLLRQSRHRGIELIANRGKPSFNPEMQRDLYSSNGLKITTEVGELERLSKLELMLEDGSIDWLKLHPSAQRVDSTIIINDSPRYSAEHNEARSWPFKPPSQQLLSILPQISNDSSRLETVERLLTFAHNYLYYKATPTSFTTDEIITNGYGDCTEYTQLLLALLNAAKIPARKVDGYIYLGDDEKRFGGHEWVEVLIDGQWRGIDPTWNLMNTTAGHLPITIDKEKSASDLVFAVKQIHYK
jgi:hypothetical protein